MATQLPLSVVEFTRVIWRVSEVSLQMKLFDENAYVKPAAKLPLMVSVVDIAVVDPAPRVGETILIMAVLSVSVCKNGRGRIAPLMPTEIACLPVPSRPSECCPSPSQVEAALACQEPGPETGSILMLSGIRFGYADSWYCAVDCDEGGKVRLAIADAIKPLDLRFDHGPLPQQDVGTDPWR